jgi:NADH-quinone oxidoreductase subunit J
MSLVLFWIFAAIMLGFGLAVVLLRNPVSSALSLVVCFLALAALFIQLEAFFVGVVQILVYAGAVMVLFLFIIMLLDLKTETLNKLSVPTLATGLVVIVVAVLTLVVVLGEFPAGNMGMPATNMQLQEDDAVAGAPGVIANPVALPEDSPLRYDDVKSLGMLLFRDYALPLQLVGVLILVATVGVVILSKRELK